MSNFRLEVLKSLEKFHQRNISLIEQKVKIDQFVERNKEEYLSILDELGINNWQNKGAYDIVLIKEKISEEESMDKKNKLDKTLLNELSSKRYYANQLYNNLIKINYYQTKKDLDNKGEYEIKIDRFLNNIEKIRNNNYQEFIDEKLKELGLSIENIKTNKVEFETLVKAQSESINSITKEIMKEENVSDKSYYIYLDGRLLTGVEKKEIELNNGELINTYHFKIKTKSLDENKTKTINVSMYEKEYDVLKYIKENSIVHIYGEYKPNEKDGFVYHNFTAFELLDISKTKNIVDIPMQISFSGNLADKPEIEKVISKDGEELNRVSFAVYENIKDEEPVIHFCNAIGVNDSYFVDFNKGDFVKVEGELVTYEKDGEIRESVNVRDIKQIQKKELEKEKVVEKEEKEFERRR